MEDQQQAKKYFNVPKYLESKGISGRFKGAAEEGKIMLEVDSPEGPQVKKFNLKAMIDDDASLEQKPSSDQLVFNTPETPSPSSMGFLEKVHLNLAKDPESKSKILKENYGENNVRANADGSIVIRDGGEWKRVESGFLDQLASESPVTGGAIAGGAAGAKLGAVAGSVAGPIGSALGGATGLIAGGAIGAGLAKWGQIEAAQALGIRNEQDAIAVQKEVGEEIVQSLIWDTVTLGAGKALRGPGKFITDRVGNLAKHAFNSFTDKAALSEVLEKVILPGTKRADWEVVLRSADDAADVKAYRDQLLKWKTAKASGKAVSAFDPVTTDLASTARTSLKDFKDAAFKNYGEANEILEKSGVFKGAKIDITDTAQSFENQLRSMGMVDETGNWLTKGAARSADVMQQVFDPKSQRVMREIFTDLKSASKKGDLDWGHAKALMGKVDDVLSASGFHQGGDLAVSDQTRRQLKGLRAQISAKFDSAIPKDKMVSFAGKEMTAKELYQTNQKKYHKFRTIYDDFDLVKAGEAGPDRLISTTNKMLGDTGDALEAAFLELGEIVGKPAKDALTKMQRLRAARNLGDNLAPSITGEGAIKQGLVKIATGVSGPGQGVQFAEKAGRRIEAAEQFATSTPGSLVMSTLRGMGKLSSFLTNLGEEKSQLYQNPQAMRALFKPILEVGPTQMQVQEALQQQIPGQQNGQ